MHHRLARAISSTISTCQDVVSFTGSADTAAEAAAPSGHRPESRSLHRGARLAQRRHPRRPMPAPGTPEFDLFVKEVAREMTVKAGQKCTAIRRAIAPERAVRCRDRGPARAPREGHGRRPANSTASAWARSSVSASADDVLAQRGEAAERGRHRRRRSGQLHGRGRRPRARRLHPADPAALPGSDPRHQCAQRRSLRAGLHGDGLRRPRSGRRPGKPRRWQPGRLGLSPTILPSHPTSSSASAPSTDAWC